MWEGHQANMDDTNTNRNHSKDREMTFKSVEGLVAIQKVTRILANLLIGCLSNCHTSHAPALCPQSVCRGLLIRVYRLQPSFSSSIFTLHGGEHDCLGGTMVMARVQLILMEGQ